LTFNSLQYALFLPVVVIGYWLLPRRVRQLWLLGASYVFYAFFDVRWALLLLFTTIVDYNVGKGLEDLGDRAEHDAGTTARRRRKLLLLVSVSVNLGVLGIFKYFDFFVAQVADGLSKIGLDATAPALRVLLPFGISFYTFQSIGYTVDVYRRQIRACRSPIDFATFVAYFPQLVAGPISRAKNLLPQIEADRMRPTSRQLLSGLLLFLLGLFKKVVIADPLAAIVAKTFGGQPDQGTLAVVVGVLAFALQIYADFSGYTDMARGTSRLLNVELVHNFDQPYLSRNITEFWRRWHISLSTWLRDYVYIPLGGNRGSRARTYRNLMVTMLLGGLWHGAGWNFVIWGGLHGLYLCLDRIRDAPRALPDRVPHLREVPAILVTFALVCFAWIFFRAHTFAQAMDVLRSLVRVGGTSPSGADVAIVTAALGAALAIDLAQRAVRHPLRLVLERPYAIGTLAGAALVGVILFSGGAATPFIYFQF
jgi:alginate O-acetyltransferase complex protein AlgI